MEIQISAGYRADNPAIGDMVMSTWMMSGPGQALFLGNPNVSQFDPSGQVSPGAGYIPDEVAKMIVKESGLRKSDCIPKKVIVGYLESMGLSAGLAPDVAMVLRNVYGLTPTFDESTLYGRSSALIEELVGIVSESYPAPFRFDEPEILNEDDFIASYIASEYMGSTDSEYDIALEHLAVISPDDFMDIAEFYEWVGPEGFAYLGDLVENGPDGLAEEVLEALCYPDRPMSEDVQYHFEKVDMSKFPSASKVLAQQQGSSRMDQSLSKGASLLKQKSDVRKQGVARMDKAMARGASRLRKQTVGKASDKARTGLDKAARRQAKMHAKDVAGVDPLAKKAAAAKSTGFSGMLATHGSKEAHDAKMKLQAKKQAVSQADKSAKSASRKEMGKKALGLMGKAAAAPFKLAGAAVGHAAQGAGYLHGRAKGGSDNAQAAPSAARAAAPSAAKSAADDSAPKKRGVLHRIGQALSGFHKRFMANRPGIADQKAKADAAPKREKGPAGTASVGESVARSGSLLSEMRDVLDGESSYRTEDPFDVFSRFEASDLVGQAVIEALSQLDWDEVCQLASIAMLPVEESQSLVSAYQNGAGDFFHAWRGVESRVSMPSALTKESFSLLANLSMDEGVVPALIGYSYRALQAASDDVAMCVEDAYPDLGRMVYGPAGNPSEGPGLAKSYMTPHACSTDSPDQDREIMTTRMFADPSVIDRERASRLSDVKNVLGAMRSAAATAGVAPEGMFLNTYRDMHREKARYS